MNHEFFNKQPMVEMKLNVIVDENLRLVNPLDRSVILPLIQKVDIVQFNEAKSYTEKIFVYHDQ